MASFSARLSWPEKLTLTAGRDMWSTHPLPEHGLAAVRMADGPMGLTGGRVDERDIALLTPCGLALAASWDHDLVYRIGQIIGDEALRIGVQAVLAPNLNLMRSPLAGRAFELFGEDPYLIAVLGGAWAQGVQSKGVASVIKHLVCNDSETDRRHLNVSVDEATLREVYFQPFEYCARHGAWAMLTGYNRVNGVACAEQAKVVGEWLKTELNWDGLVMSDWFGTQNGLASLQGGLDLEMPGPARHMGRALLETSELPEVKRVDDAVDRLARLASRVMPSPTYQNDEKAQAARLALLEEAAAAGMVLLRNDHLLPFDPTALQTLAVIGPNAERPCFQGGTFAKVALTPEAVSPLTAIRNAMAASGVQVAFAKGAEADYRIPPLTHFALMTEERVPGLEVTVHAKPGAAASYRETRYASSLVWFKELPGVGNLLALEDEAEIRVRTRFTARGRGVYRFYLGGTGLISLALDGEAIGSFEGQSLGQDVMGTLMQAPHTVVEFFLEAEQTVRLEFVMRIGKSLAHGLWFGAQAPQVTNQLEEALQVACSADAVVLMVGETADAGLESVDRKTTQLSPAQIELIEQVCAVNENTVVILNVAHPVETACMAKARAILLVWYPGQEFGPALAQVLTGAREPGGRLPVTFARQESDYPVWSLTPDAQGQLAYHEGWWVGYRHFVANNIAPAFALGHGLGYARFRFLTCSVNAEDSHGLNIRVSVQNVADRAGKEVVQLYLREPDPGSKQPRVSLKAFQAVRLEPGATADVQLTLAADIFFRWCPIQQKRMLIPGRYELWIGQAVDAVCFKVELEANNQGVMIMS